MAKKAVLSLPQSINWFLIGLHVIKVDAGKFLPLAAR